jgi:5,10-methenyltetrahydrofolate synthetase
MIKENARKHCKDTLRNLCSSTSQGFIPPLSALACLSYLSDATSDVLLYQATSIEPSTDLLIDYLFFQTDIRIYIPNTSHLTPVFTRLLPDTRLTRTSKNILEDASPVRLFYSHEFPSTSLCIVPCLGMNRKYFRLGYGSGFYDIFLKDFLGVSLGIVHNKNIVEFSPEPHDVPLNNIIAW